MAKIAIVAPTYNERENLEQFTREILSLKIPELKLIIVDDNSPDGTGELAEQLAEEFPIEVIHRKRKGGPGPAYAAGFLRVLEHQSADYIIQMDVDLSHNPEDIKKMIQAARDCDLVIGSRYVDGARIQKWNFTRRLISRLGNIYARAVLGIPVKDITSGFKCWRRGALQKLNFENLSEMGFAFQMETIYQAYRSGFSIREVPISFYGRRGGRSSYNLMKFIKGFFGAFFKVLALRRRGRPK